MERRGAPLGDLDLGVGHENETHRPLPGQVLLYPGGESEPEIPVPYGATAFAAKSGPLAGNHFVTIVAEEHLREIGGRVWREGALDAIFKALPDGDLGVASV